MQWVRGAGLVLGVPLILLIGFVIIAFVLRVVMIEMQGPAVDEEHLAAKKIYLAQLQPGVEKPFKKITCNGADPIF